VGGVVGNGRMSTLSVLGVFVDAGIALVGVRHVLVWSRVVGEERKKEIVDAVVILVECKEKRRIVEVAARCLLSAL